MKKSELKKILKPIVKECIQEALLEEGVISVLIKEVLKGTTPAPLLAAAPPLTPTPTVPPAANVDRSGAQKHLEEAKKRLLKSIGGDVDVFAGTTPLNDRGSSATTAGSGPLSGISPSDAGVDISSLAGNATNIWNRINEGKK
jgi:hypothetical protein